MKISKVGALVASLFVIFSIVFAETVKTVEFDLKHAVQHIGGEVKIQAESGTGGDYVATLLQQHAKLRIISKGDGNFLLFTGNSISLGSSKSNILGGSDNELGSTDILPEGSTIIAGNDNRNFSDFSIIGGGSDNQISSGRWNVIAGGSENQINGGTYSVIIGGNNNEVKGENSVTVGVNNEVKGNSSVALGSGASISGGNSFLWTDNGARLEANDVFAVVGERGMVINTNAAHDLAQLTVGGSLVVGEGSGDSNIQCDSNGKGIIKLVDKIGDQKCLCSCNGSNWDSLLGDGQCKSICNGSDTITAVCGNEISIFVGEDGKRQYSGSCNSGTVVEGSYYVSNTNVWWTCQEANGSVDMCSLTLGCTGRIPDNAHANNNISPNGEYEYSFSNNVGDICTYSCDAGYAHYGTGCEQICKYDTMGGSCYFGERLPSEGTRTNNYVYSCRYGGFDYKCSASCPTNYIWAGDSGSLTGCQQQVSACSETTKYVCNLGTPYTGRLDDENDLNFRWECVDTNNNTIGGTGCSLAKPVESRDVYYDKQEITAGTIISFRMTGAIEPGVEIKLHKTNQTETFIITGGETRSAGKTYTQNTSSYYARFPNGTTTTNVIMPTKVYSLKIVDGTVTPNLCATTCAKAGTCQYWSTSSAFASGINGNTATFTWTCRSGSVVDTGCRATCNIKSGSCVSVPANATSCDANQNGCTPLKGASINLRNFYLDAAGNVTSNGSGYRQHCVFSGGKINCEDATNPYTWAGWKCNSGFTMNVASCSCEGGSACNSSIYSGLCTYGTTTLGEATYTSGYTYWCASSSETCNAKCGTGKVWAGGTLKCIDSTGLCTDEDSSHVCNYGSERKYLSGGASYHAWEWKCERGEISKVCHHCLTGYTRNGTQCSATSVNCESTGIILNSVNYTVPALNHNASTGVAGRNSIKFCTATASCSNGVASLSNVNCTNACGTGPSDTPKCNTGSVYSKDGTTYKSSYGYYCKNGTWMSTKCSINCNSGKYWNGTQCVTAPTVCSGTHYNCIAPGQLVAGSTNYVINGANYVYSWNCGTGDIVKPCSQTTVNTGAYNCSGTTISNYTIPPLNNNDTTTVEKFTDVGQCTATAKCRTGVVSLYSESCPAIVACNGSGGCNLGTVGGYDGATYSNSYSYKCYGEGITWNCSANCPSGKVWNGTQCVDNDGGCVNNSHYNCTASTPYNTGEVTKGYYWDCKDGDGAKLNTNRCYECKSGYVYSGTAEACVGKELSCSGTRPEHSTGGTSTYTYSGTIRSWTRTTGTLGLCKYMCHEHYTGDNCNPETVDCSGSHPSDNVTLGQSTYLYNGSEKTWTSVSYSVLGSCQFRCDTGFTYNSGTNKCDNVCTPTLSTPCRGGFTALPSVASWNTYYTCNGYTCNCGTNNVWNGDMCVLGNGDLCVQTSIDGGCNYSNKSDLVKYDNNAWSTWKCKNGVTEENCHYCSQHYHWNSSLNKCVGDTLNCSGLVATSNVAKGSGSYVYSGTIRNWTNITSGNPGLCQFKCNNYYHWDSSAGNCVGNTLSCSGSTPTANVTKGTGSYTYSGTIRNWTNITSGNPGLCQFKCNTGSIYNSSTNKCDNVCAPSSTTPCNGGYTANGTQWGTGYTCKKSGYSDVSCACGVQNVWNGDMCVVGNGSLCIQTSIDGGCNYSNKSNLVKHNSTWSTWKCKNAVKEENCHYCPSGYTWDESKSECALNGVTIVANVKNTSSSCTITQVTAVVDGSSYIGSCIISPNAGDTCSFGVKKAPGNGHSISLVSAPGGSNCILDSNGQPTTIHELGWLGGQEHGPENYNGYFWSCGCTGQSFNGVCNNNTTYGCLSGTAIQKQEVSPYSWVWICQGVNGGSNSSWCSYKVKFDGVCNPNREFACNGPMTPVNTGYNTGTNTYTWICPGINGGTSVNCSLSGANKIDGKCGSSLYTCASGSIINKDSPFVRHGGYGPLWAGNFWQCSGSNGGSTATCGTYWLCPSGSCHPSSSAYAAGCARVYSGGVLNSGRILFNTPGQVDTASRSKYCGKQISKSECESVGVLKRVQNLGSTTNTYYQAQTLPYDGSYDSSRCCDYTGGGSDAVCFVDGSYSSDCSSSNKPTCG